MSNISIKKNFQDGDILPASDLNNNFMVIEAGINANEENLQQVIDEAIVRLDNELIAITADRGWDWNGGDRVTFYKGDTDAIDDRDIINGQLLYNIETGETALDDDGNRIITGSGNVIAVDDEEPTNPATKLWINPDEPLNNIGTEVVNSMNGNETNLAPSVAAAKGFINNIISSSNREGVVKIGNIGIEWGTVNVTPTSGTEPNFYGSELITFQNNYKYQPAMIACAGAGYTNITNVAVINVTASSGGVWMCATAQSARLCRYFVIGEVQ